MNWSKIGEEASDLLSRYIRIDTSNPPGNEAQAVEFLGMILEDNGIDFKTYESAPGRVNLLARLRGEGNNKPLLLLSHSDVVPAESGGWDEDPFSGLIKDGVIWGRGTLDMKGMGIMELMSILLLKRNQIPLNRDVLLLVVADEESGGKFGIEYMLTNHLEELETDFVLNEGGMGNISLLPNNQPAFFVSTGEKGPIWLQLSVRGSSGHASMPHDQNALLKLMRVILKLTDEESQVVIVPTMREFFTRVGPRWPFLEPFLKEGTEDALTQSLIKSGIMAVPAINAVLRNTISPTRMTAGERENVIPERAEAVVDCRILPGTSVDEFVERVRGSVSELGVEVQVLLQSAPSVSLAETHYFQALERVLKKNVPDQITLPVILPGTTDSRFFRYRGVTAYGLIPALCTLDDIQSVHGKNEKISVDNLTRGTKSVYDFVVEICHGGR